MKRSSEPLRSQKLTETPSICRNTARHSKPMTKKIDRLEIGLPKVWVIAQFHRQYTLFVDKTLVRRPMTRQRKGYPFEIVIGAETDRESVVLADQVKSLDWKVRKAVKKGFASIE